MRLVDHSRLKLKFSRGGKLQGLGKNTGGMNVGPKPKGGSGGKSGGGKGGVKSQSSSNAKRG